MITLRGEWDVSTRERLREALHAVGTESDVLVDLRQASFFDSTALAELIALYKRLNGAGGGSKRSSATATCAACSSSRVSTVRSASRRSARAICSRASLDAVAAGRISPQPARSLRNGERELSDRRNDARAHQARIERRHVTLVLLDAGA